MFVRVRYNGLLMKDVIKEKGLARPFSFFSPSLSMMICCSSHYSFLRPVFGNNSFSWGKSESKVNVFLIMRKYKSWIRAQIRIFF